ncbi:MAG: Uncharacterised protein [SAR116 cluster bacterium MED-G04]|nr:MAG: Uncharacterised protein [SAR116 cluster bacterium MED-G04]
MRVFNKPHPQANGGPKYSRQKDKSHSSLVRGSLGEHLAEIQLI